jgi:hypothetical protein
MSFGKVEGNKYWGRCERYGRRLEVRPQPGEAGGYFIEWRASFSCFGQDQTATLTLEKDEIDFH